MGAPPFDFEASLLAVIPDMRAFARSMCRNPVDADDLVQEALFKALKNRHHFEPGTNIKAWAFTILRNQFFSEKRRSWRSTPLNQELAESIADVGGSDRALEINELRQALTAIPDHFREALVLIGAGGMSYDEAAAIMGIAVGTVKSRVSRARVQLAALLESGDFRRDRAKPSEAMATILQGVPEAG